MSVLVKTDALDITFPHGLTVGHQFLLHFFNFKFSIQRNSVIHVFLTIPGGGGFLPKTDTYQAPIPSTVFAFQLQSSEFFERRHADTQVCNESAGKWFAGKRFSCSGESYK